MRLSVSNIAWLPEEDEDVFGGLLSEGIDALEIAPTRFWSDPTLADLGAAARLARRHARLGLEILSFQSLLFARPELRLFGSAADRAQMLDYLVRIADLAHAMEVRRMVLGSPKNRFVPESMSTSESMDIAVEFFGVLGAECADRGSVLCIEPNPTDYGCNFVTTSSDGIALVDAVASEGFGLHLDVAGLVMAGEDPAVAVHAADTRVRHVHASAPWLAELEDRTVDHRTFGAALTATGYAGVVAIEMRAGEAGSNRNRVLDAVRLARGAYED